MVMRVPFEFVHGVTFEKVTINMDQHEVLFYADTGDLKWRMYHQQDCCEYVDLAEIIGDVNDLVGSPILQAEVVTNDNWDGPEPRPDSHTWTFYKFATHKGRVVFRWLGQSNGYYSEAVDFESF